MNDLILFYPDNRLAFSTVCLSKPTDKARLPSIVFAVRVIIGSERFADHPRFQNFHHGTRGVCIHEPWYWSQRHRPQTYVLSSQDSTGTNSCRAAFRLRLLTCYISYTENRHRT